ncbi:group II intron reverse transcriptase/maturase [Candidatus Chloroploca sp. M-50]|uniref:Group II intron reverse transcriptase/maturase n=1 Tax=Candidatus Chloroploca mongolica TaxID=2528176 RepID=A0ABS4D503_9CHLR|nr:group II intron reverse transcriptase/maturase [Candidatus Chloroploca mongolica]
MNIFTEPTEAQTEPTWADISWAAVERHVRRLQERIYRATERQEWNKVKDLQKLLVRATSNKLLAIRRVTQENRGKRTAGVDGVICDTPEARMHLLSDGLSLNGYRPKPARRVYIPKSDGKQRPLGIPTVKDRVMQAIVKAALEPEWEARFEANSYGFRPGRSTMDAITAIHTTLNQQGSSKWILDADIKGCFDTIDHTTLLNRVPVFAAVIRRWLKAGVVELGHYTDTEAGTPQGGVISPLLANIALDGMERLFGAETPEGKLIPPAKRKHPNSGISLIRYADDFVVTAPTRAVLETYVQPRIVAFLSERGLTLSEAKTRIVHVTEGFNFLGFQIRRFKRTLLTTPQKEKVHKHLRSIKAYLDTHQQEPAGKIVHDLNPVIRGWANYYRHCAAKQTFSKVRHRQWQMLWRWAKRRHPNKGSRWVKQRYFRNDGYWTFADGNAELVKPTSVPITRYVKVSGRNSPYDPKLRAYWQERTKRQIARQTASQVRRELLYRYGYRCGMCWVPFATDDPIEADHIVPRHAGGSDEPENKRPVHRWCHHQHHQRRGYKVLKA